MSSPNVSARQVPISAEFVPSLPGSVSQSRINTPAASLSGSQFATPHTKDLSYTFINADFIDEHSSFLPGTAPANAALHFHNGASVAAFRNLTSTPRSSHPVSLPKSLPIDWNLFNKQYELQQRRKQARLKRRRSEGELENNFENLPYPLIDFIADCVESQNDLINLSLTCKFFNKMINRRLYSKLIFVDNISNKFMHYDGGYTLVDANNYPKLLASLHSNEELIGHIKEIIIDTSSNNSSYDALSENIYSALYDLFLTTNNNLRVLENLDFNNLKKFNTLIRYNTDHLIKHNYNKYTYYYPQSECIDDVIRKDLLHLRNFQLLDLNDLNRLPLSANTVSVVIEHELHSLGTFKLQYAGYKVLERLETLKFHTAVAYETFINEMYRMYTNSNHTTDPTMRRLENIRTLSIATIHHPEDLTHMSRLSFEKLNLVIDLSKVVNFEIKTKCLDPHNCNSCVLHFMLDWHNELNMYSSSNLKKLSIISLPPSANHNVNIQWDSIMCHSSFLQSFGENVEFFFINLNDFPFVPIFEKTEALEVRDSMKLPINEEILRTRKGMYTNVLDSFKKLELMIIPDFFYNWMVYNNITDLSNDEHLNYLNFLDVCHCSSCCESRALFKKYAHQHQFKDFKGRFQTNLSYGPRNPHQNVTRYNKLDDDPDMYRILYNYILRELKSRIPLKQLNKVQCSLEYDKFVPNVRSKSPVIPQEDFAKFTKMFAHGLRPEIQKILDTLSKVKKFNLGGMLFKCHSAGYGKVRVHALYDDFDEVFVKTGY